MLDLFYLEIFGNFWELTEILDPFNLGISENVWEWELFEMSDKPSLSMHPQTKTAQWKTIHQCMLLQPRII